MSRFTAIRRWPRLALVLAALLGGCATLDEQQRKSIFHPSTSERVPTGSAVDGMEDVWIEHVWATSGRAVRLHALRLPQPRADAPLLLYLHGARRNVWGSTYRMRNMQEPGFAVLAVDYRGFGCSSAELPSEEAVLEDARAAWGWLAREHPQRPRYLFGHSLGGTVAVRLAGVVDDSRRLMVEGTFTSIPGVYCSLKWGWLPITPFITQRFESDTRIARVRAPVLLVHGSEDRLIRPELGRALYERAAAPMRFVLVEGDTRRSTNGVGQRLYRESLHELFGLKS